MKTKRSLIVFVLIIVGYMQLLSQNTNSDNLRCMLFEFLISKGDFNKDMKTGGVLLIINDISSLEKFNEQEIGIFKFGTLTSHSCFHVFFKDHEGFTIIDMKQPYESIVPFFLNYFQRNQEYTKEEVLNYFKNATELYRKNQGVVPWKLDE